MKTRFFSLLAVCLLLSGCVGEPVYPERAADGADWDETWLMHGSILGIEGAAGFTLLENYAILTMSGVTTSVWGVGTPERSVNENGKDEENWYHAQIYVLVKEFADEQEARNAVEDWTDRLDKTWNITDVWEEEHNGQTYTIRDCESLSEDSPWRRELAAFTCCGSNAVSVELDCRDSFDSDADEILSGFLDKCHYNAGLLN